MATTLRERAAPPALQPAQRRLVAGQRRALISTLRRARELRGYAEAFAATGGELGDPYATLQQLPVLERSAVQGDPEVFCDPRAPGLTLTSSGSTGTPLELRLDPRARRSRQRWFAAYFLRSGWRPWHRALSFKVIPDDSARLGSDRFDRSVLRRRRTVSVLEPVSRQFEALRGHDPQILHGLPSVFEQLALRAEAEGWQPGGLERIFSCSEALTPTVRRLIERVFGVPVLDSYAAAEAIIGWECGRRHGIHVLEDRVVLEVLDEAGRAVAPGAIGRVVITTLDNPSMPLVRYAIGDMAVAPTDERCACGRPERLVPRILGRQVPYFDVDGAMLSPWGVIARMHELDAVGRFQLVQEAPNRLLVLIKPRPGAEPVDRRALERLVAEQLGPTVAVELREVGELAALASGKQAPALVSGGDARR